MKKMTQIGVLVAVMTLVTWPASGREPDPRAVLSSQDITSVRVNLNPWGAELGFELEVDGDDPRVEALVAAIQGAESGGGHKCPNQGAIRFQLADGRVIGVGLLPSHTPGLYELRLYDDDRYLGAYRVQRTTLLATLEAMGVPVDDPAFKE